MWKDLKRFLVVKTHKIVQNLILFNLQYFVFTKKFTFLINFMFDLFYLKKYVQSLINHKFSLINFLS